MHRQREGRGETLDGEDLQIIVFDDSRTTYGVDADAVFESLFLVSSVRPSMHRCPGLVGRLVAAETAYGFGWNPADSAVLAGTVVSEKQRECRRGRRLRRR